MNQLTVPNGYFPDISDDGLTIVCGFNQVLSVALPSGDVTTLLPDDASHAGFHNGQSVISHYVALAPQVYGRNLVGGPITPDPAQSPGYQPGHAVRGGRVFSSAGGRHYVQGVAMDYGPDSPPVEAIEHVSKKSGAFYIHKEQNSDPQPLCVRLPDGSLYARINEATMWARVYEVNGHPLVFANLVGGGSVLYHANGTRFHVFQPGEFRGDVVDGPNGEYWAITCGLFQDGSGIPFICARPFSNLAGPGIIRRGMWYAHFQGMWKPIAGRWVWAGCYDGINPVTGLNGQLDIDTDVDPDEPKEVLNVAGSTPAGPVTPVPSIPVPAEPPISPGSQVIKVDAKVGDTVIIQIVG